MSPRHIGTMSRDITNVPGGDSNLRPLLGSYLGTNRVRFRRSDTLRASGRRPVSGWLQRMNSTRSA